MKDEDLATFSDFFKDLVIQQAKPYYQYDPALVPDHWFEPVQVWEVKAADLSISPAHKAAAGLVSFLLLHNYPMVKHQTSPLITDPLRSYMILLHSQVQELLPYATR